MNESGQQYETNFNTENVYLSLLKYIVYSSYKNEFGMSFLTNFGLAVNTE